VLSTLTDKSGCVPSFLLHCDNVDDCLTLSAVLEELLMRGVSDTHQEYSRHSSLI